MPTLSDYESQTQLLLNDTAEQEYSLANLDSYINTARGQIAASSQCVRFTGTLAITSAAQSYPLASISGLPSGVTAALSAYNVARAIANAGYAKVYPRPWQWAWFYWQSNPVPQSGPPTEWSTQEPGPLGSIYLNKLPDQNYTLSVDCSGAVAALTSSDSPPEVISYPYTDAVPYFAAYMALLNSQRNADAQQMLQRWAQFSSWAVKQLTPPVLPDYYPGGKGAMEAAQRILQSGVGTQSR